MSEMALNPHVGSSLSANHLTTIVSVNYLIKLDLLFK